MFQFIWIVYCPVHTGYSIRCLELAKHFFHWASLLKRNAATKTFQQCLFIFKIKGSQTHWLWELWGLLERWNTTTKRKPKSARVALKWGREQGCIHPFTRRVGAASRGSLFGSESGIRGTSCSCYIETANLNKNANTSQEHRVFLEQDCWCSDEQELGAFWEKYILGCKCFLVLDLSVSHKV